MFHQFSRVTGRMVAATHLQSPLLPITPSAIQIVEAPAIKYTAAHLSTVPEPSACPAPKRRLVPGTNIPFPPVPQHIVESQKKFQKDDDVPIHLKGGPMDVILFRITMGLCLIGLVGVADTFYRLATK